jgi:hypothetical protein
MTSGSDDSKVNKEAANSRTVPSGEMDQVLKIYCLSSFASEVTV